MGIDVRSNDKRHNVEKRYPGLFREEHLRECQRKGGCDPTDAHYGHEAGADGGANLVPGTRTRDDRHRGQVDCVLDRGDLNRLLVMTLIDWYVVVHMLRTIKLLTMICKIFALRLVRFAKVRCKSEINR